MIELKDDRQYRALTGLSAEKHAEFVKIFSQVYTRSQQQAYQAGQAAGTRTRKPGGGQKGHLPMMEDKANFILYYHKCYPTFDNLGSHFHMGRGRACDWVHKLTPYLALTLIEGGWMPAREFDNVEALKAACEGLEEIIIDVTERQHQRPQDPQEQRDFFSGKKRRHTVKNTIMSSLKRVILFVGQTFSGHNHDYTMLKEEFPPDEAWFKELKVLADLGYQGIKSDYEGEDIEIPHKKPRKSKANPNTTLTDEQKAYNQALSKIRIYVEHAIGGLKRFNILTHPFRNHRPGFADQVIATCAGLWNFSLA